jgi:hypothetical protein
MKKKSSQLNFAQDLNLDLTPIVAVVAPVLEFGFFVFSVVCTGLKGHVKQYK